MKDRLKKALNLVKNTGDKIIIFDNIQNSDTAYVIMNMDEYEDIVLKNKEISSLTEEELLDKINRDIAVWKSLQDFENPSNYSDQYELKNTVDEGGRNIPTSQEDLMPEPRIGEKKRWTIREDVKDGAEEIIEEDRQYLEEITF
jgi:hypothetical protein